MTLFFLFCYTFLTNATLKNYVIKHRPINSPSVQMRELVVHTADVGIGLWLTKTMVAYLQLTKCLNVSTLSIQRSLSLSPFRSLTIELKCKEQDSGKEALRLPPSRRWLALVFFLCSKSTTHRTTKQLIDAITLHGATAFYLFFYDLSHLNSRVFYFSFKLYK